jgi:chain length determinant protein EpsF
MISPAYMATQVDIVNSDRVAQRVVKRLQMAEQLALQAEWQEATKGKGDLTAWLADALKKKLSVKPSRESNVINISYSDTDPLRAAAVANAFAQAYIDVSLELKVEPARQNAVWFEGQTRLLRDKLEAAQAALSSYQQQTGIIGSDGRVDLESAKLNELFTQLALVQAQTSDSYSKRKSTGRSATLSEMFQNPLVNALKTDIARLEAKLQDSNINLGKNHPQTLRTESELASLKQKLSSETSAISNSIGTAYQVGRQKEQDLLAAIDAQKTRFLALGKQRDEISVLQREIDSAQRAFDSVSQRSAQTRLESLSVQTNAVVLNPASPPADQSKPKIFLNVIVSIFLGTLLGIGLALLLELGKRRIRSVEDLAEAIDLPVLAAIACATPAPTLRDNLRRTFPRRGAATPLLGAAAS